MRFRFTFIEKQFNLCVLRPLLANKSKIGRKERENCLKSASEKCSEILITTASEYPLFLYFNLLPS